MKNKKIEKKQMCDSILSYSKNYCLSKIVFEKNIFSVKKKCLKDKIISLTICWLWLFCHFLFYKTILKCLGFFGIYFALTSVTTVTIATTVT